ncbi:MAG: hypothetical protein KUG72_11925 [Pseudomonadales bacterium]|nr:hypothetical protein [Pseudomonadales bacterium]
MSDLVSLRAQCAYILSLVCIVTSFPAYAECIAHAADLSYEQDELYDGFLLGADGCLYDPSQYSIDDIPPVLPVEPAKSKIPGVFVNGKGNTALMQLENLQLLADTTGLPMVGIHNAARVGWSEFTAMGPDAIPTKIVRENILRRINADIRIRIWSSSQGTFYVSGALSQTREQLKDQARLDLIEIITTGGAAPFWIDGPRYVHYINKQDPVPALMGPASFFAEPGRGAVLATFDYLNEDPADGCADNLQTNPNDTAIISWLMGKVLVKNAHIVCVHTPFFEEFDQLRDLSNSDEKTMVNLPLTQSVSAPGTSAAQLRESI